MPLLMLDLDNTLVDRDAAFRSAVGAFLAGHALPVEDEAWWMELDAGGYADRADVAAAALDRYGPRAPGPALDALLDHGASERATLAAATGRALEEARAAGWRSVIVTNGRTRQQETTIRRCGLDALVDGWVVSEAVGHRKPEPAIFALAAEAVGGELDEHAWMVGDHAHADVAGGQLAGAWTAWVSGGRAWREPSFRPDHVAHDAASAIDHIVRH